MVDAAKASLGLFMVFLALGVLNTAWPAAAKATAVGAAVAALATARLWLPPRLHQPVPLQLLPWAPPPSPERAAGQGVAWALLLGAAAAWGAKSLRPQPLWWLPLLGLLPALHGAAASLLAARAARQGGWALTASGLWLFPWWRALRGGTAGGWLAHRHMVALREALQEAVEGMARALDAALLNTGKATRTVRVQAWPPTALGVPALDRFADAVDRALGGPVTTHPPKPQVVERHVRLAKVRGELLVYPGGEQAVGVFHLVWFGAFDLAAHQAWVSLCADAPAVLGVPRDAVRADETGRLLVLLATAPAEEEAEEAEEATAEVPLDLSPLAPGCPPLDVLPQPVARRGRPNEGKTAAERVRRALAALGVEAGIAGVSVGPTSVAIVVRPQGVKGSQVLRLREDLAVELGAPDLRLAPTPDAPGCIAVELPRKHPDPLAFVQVAADPAFRQAKGALPLALGVDTAGRAIVVDLAAAPHLLAAGTTGSGKTAALHCLILSLLLRHPPQRLRLILVDPKMTEFSLYDNLPHLLAPVVTEVTQALAALGWLVGEMDRRYAVMSKLGVQNIDAYNAKAADTLPRIVLVVDEVADMMLAGKKSEREETQQKLARLLAKARAAGIHCVLATQRPTVDVVPGLIKANAPARLALAVQSEMDSRIIIDQPGAESLRGKGDALLMWPGWKQPVRLQVPWAGPDAVEAVVGWWRDRAGGPSYDPTLMAALAAATGDAVPPAAPAPGAKAGKAAPADWAPDD